MSLILNTFNEPPVYEIVKLDYNKTTQESTLHVILRLPTEENPILTTIKMPFTTMDPWQKYSKPPYTFRDNMSVFLNPDLFERVQIMGQFRSMGLAIRFATQCEYDNWIYEAGNADDDDDEFKQRTGYIVWATIKEYVENL